MKKTKTNAIAKKAQKALKKDLSDKIAAQIKAALGEIGPGLKKAEKSIEKAAKNLAKKLSKITNDKSAKSVPAKKAAPVAKAQTVAVETEPIKAQPAKPAVKATAVKTPAKPAAVKTPAKK